MVRQLNVPKRLDILIEKMLNPIYTWEIDLDQYDERKIIHVTKGNDEGVYITFFRYGQVELGTYKRTLSRTKFIAVSRSALFESQKEALQHMVDQFGINELRKFITKSEVKK